MTPIGERLLVRRRKGAEISTGGLVLPNGHDRGLSCEGVVERVGVGLRWDGKRAVFDVSTGDCIVYSSRIDTREVDGALYDLVENGSVIGVIDAARL